MAVSGNYITESDVDNWSVVTSVEEAFAISAVDIVNNQITLITNDVPTCTEIRFSSDGIVPGPLVTGIVYYAIYVSPKVFKVAETPVDAAAGTPIDLIDVGSGTHTLDIGSGSSETERQEVIDRAEQLIEKITRDYFYTKTFEVYRDGNGKDKLFLKFIPHVLSVTEIKLSGVVLGADWYTFDINSVYLDPEAATGDDYPELLLRLKYKTRLFPKGQGNVKITGTYGWASCPVAIKRAAIMLCRYENDNTLYSVHSSDLKSEKIGDYSYTMSDKTSSKDTTGIDEIDKLLKNYIRRRPMLSA